MPLTNTTLDGVLNPALNAVIAADPAASRTALQSPKTGIPAGALFGGKFMAESIHTNPQVRGLYFGDSITYAPDAQLRSILGGGGRMFYSGESTRAGGAAATTNPDFSKSFNGGWVNLATGTATYHTLGVSTEGFLGRQIQVWFWSETGGGTFSVGYDTTTGGVGSYTTLTTANSTMGGTAIYTGATGVINAAEGAAGQLRLVTFTLTDPQFSPSLIGQLVGLSKTEDQSA